MEGKLSSYFQDQVLLDQPFIKDETKVVRDLIDEATQKFGRARGNKPICTHLVALAVMAYLIFILIAAVLLVGFFFLSDYETRRGTRVFARERAHLDEQVERVEFVLANVDLSGAHARRVSSRCATHRARHCTFFSHCGARDRTIFSRVS